MLIVTNRNLKPTARKAERMFGAGFNEKGPDELRLAEAKKSRGKWQVQILDDRVKRGTKRMWASEGAFLDLQERMGKKARPCLFFVHGFNNDFADVLERGRLLERNYGVEVVAFTWPANGRESSRAGGLISYKSDKRDALRSIAALDRTFEKLGGYFAKYTESTLRCNQRITLMMHSMGNYLFKHLMRSSVYQGETALFDNVVLAAADVNNQDHAVWLDRVAYRRRLYVTINEDDKALRVSRMKIGSAQKARLGHYTQNLHSNNALYLDFSSARDVDSSHSYFEGAVIRENKNVRRVFRDMTHGLKAEHRLNYNAHSRTYLVP